MTPTGTIRLLSALAFGASAAACAGATPAPHGSGTGPGELRQIRLGETLAGSLAASDPRLEDGSHYDLYAFDGQAGEAINVTLSSDDFDAYLALAQHVGGELKVITSDDDGAGDLDARISTVLPRTGRYIVRANSLGEGEIGDYTIELALRPDPSRTVIRLGESRSGDLAAGDASLPAGSYYDYWIFDGTANDVVRIDLVSGDFDSFLAFGTEEGGELDIIQTDDDGGEGLDSRIYATLPRTGSYLVRASALGDRPAGAYEIRVTSEGPAGPPTREPIGLDRTHGGELARSDGRLANGAFHDLWTYQGTAGERISIDLSSSDFDSYLELGTESGGAFEEIATDDDGGDEFDSRIRVTLPETREYVIRARSLRADRTGAYTLRVATLQPEPPASREPIALDAPRTGSLSGSDARLDNDAHHDLWIYEGRAGETIEIDLGSDDFDAFIGFGYERDGVFQQLEVNDDGGEGTDSRLVVTLAEDRPYVIRATSYSGGETGEYRITVSLAARGGHAHARSAGLGELDALIRRVLAAVRE